MNKQFIIAALSAILLGSIIAIVTLKTSQNKIHPVGGVIMDILPALPDTHAGRHTEWLWSQMLAIADGSNPPLQGEIAEHFAPFEEMSSEQISKVLVQVAPVMQLVTQVVEEESSSYRYSALLRLTNSWLRYTCLTQEDEPHRILAFSYPQALDPSTYSDSRIQHNGRNVQIRDFGGTGTLMLLLHGAGSSLTSWEALVPHLAGFRVVAQDLPGHGRSLLNRFTTADALSDIDAVVANLDQGAPIIVGHSLGGYLGLRYGATRRCSGWIGLDGPVGLVYPWDLDDTGLSRTTLQISREISAFDVSSDLVAIDCPALLLLCTMVASPIEELLVPSRRELAEHIGRLHPNIDIDWVQTGHDTILSAQLADTAATISDFLSD